MSRERTIFVCYQFFKELRKRFGRKLIFTDGARWYIMMLVNRSG
jgi:transposase-like protein